MATSIIDECGSNIASRWLDKNILCLDGGGIRGYWSLLVLDRLMQYCAMKEEADFEGERNVCASSFDPAVYPENISHVPLTDQETDEQRGVNDPVERLRVLSASRRYLPCHYFDLICGSSTGALIAIMLGRLRMPVKDCIEEYQSLGDRVFGQPRKISARYQLFGNRTLYDGDNFERILKDVIERRAESVKGPVDVGVVTFAMDRDLCRTAVTSLQADSSKNRAEQQFLFRSYSCHHKIPTTNLRAPASVSYGNHVNSHRAYNVGTRQSLPTNGSFALPSRTGTGFTNASMRENRLRREQRTEHLPLWKVAKAATAADLYFPPVTIRQQVANRGEMIFRDGGFGPDNNPSYRGIQEIKEEYELRFIRNVVSVGTARLDECPAKKRWWNHIGKDVKRWTDRLSDPNEAHQKILDMYGEEQFNYFRLNSCADHVPDARLAVQLDEWKPRRSRWRNRATGSETLEKIRRSFELWAMDLESTRLLNECAEALVQHRKSRAEHAVRWERFAHGIKFRCEHQTWYDRDEFSSHLRNEHRMHEAQIVGCVLENEERWEYQSPRA